MTVKLGAFFDRSDINVPAKPGKTRGDVLLENGYKSIIGKHLTFGKAQPAPGRFEFEGFRVLGDWCQVRGIWHHSQVLIHHHPHTNFGWLLMDSRVTPGPRYVESLKRQLLDHCTRVIQEAGINHRLQSLDVVTETFAYYSKYLTDNFPWGPAFLCQVANDPGNSTTQFKVEAVPGRSDPESDTKPRWPNASNDAEPLSKLVVGDGPRRSWTRNGNVFTIVGDPLPSVPRPRTRVFFGNPGVHTGPPYDEAAMNVRQNFVNQLFRHCGAQRDLHAPDLLLFWDEGAGQFGDPSTFSSTPYNFFSHVAAMKNHGIPIDGIGIQYHSCWTIANGARGTGADGCHAQVTGYTPAQVKAAFQKFKKIGVRTHISGMDVLVGRSPRADRIAAQHQVYVDIARALRDTGSMDLTTQGLGDKDAWRGENDSPLLLDANYNKKVPLFDDVYGVLNS